jgi:hypothetical protein
VKIILQGAPYICLNSLCFWVVTLEGWFVIFGRQASGRHMIWRWQPDADTRFRMKRRRVSGRHTTRRRHIDAGRRNTYRPDAGGITLEKGRLSPRRRYEIPKKSKTSLGTPYDTMLADRRRASRHPLRNVKEAKTSLRMPRCRQPDGSGYGKGKRWLRDLIGKK